MKQTILSLAFVAALMTSCKEKTAETTDAAAVIDSAAVVVDSAAAVVDSAAVVVDSAAAAVKATEEVKK